MLACLINWFIDWCFTPTQQYFSYIMANFCIEL